MTEDFNPVADFSFSFGGVDLSEYGVGLSNSTIPVFTAPKIQTQDIPRAHGVAIRGNRLRPKTISARVVIIGDDFDDLLEKLDAVRGVLSPTHGDRELIFDHQSDRFYMARLENEIEESVIGTRAIETNLRFFCADPLAYAVDATELVYTEDGDWDGSLAYDGSAPTPIVAVGFRDTANQVITLGVENETTGRIVTADYSLGEGNFIRFDGVREIVEVSADGEEWIPVQRFVGSIQFPELVGGVNQLAFHGFEDVGESEFSWTVTFRKRYL